MFPILLLILLKLYTLNFRNRNVHTLSSVPLRDKRNWNRCNLKSRTLCFCSFTAIFWHDQCLLLESFVTLRASSVHGLIMYLGSTEESELRLVSDAGVEDDTACFTFTWNSGLMEKAIWLSKNIKIKICCSM